LREQPDLEIIPADDALFEAGLSLYESRSDKDWSLTDCISFVVMERQGCSEALTGDHHLIQAGFRALLG
jgi:predicted nucleic acid-binding protein